jgi:hypothetical protein
VKKPGRLLPPPTNELTGEPSFRWRRVSFFMIAGYCLLFLPVLAYLPEISHNNLKVAEALIDLAGWAFLIYAAGAGAQDITAIVTAKSGRPYAAPPGKVETTQTTVVETKVDPATPAVDPATIPPPGFAG